MNNRRGSHYRKTHRLESLCYVMNQSEFDDERETADPDIDTKDRYPPATLHSFIHYRSPGKTTFAKTIRHFGTWRWLVWSNRLA